MGENRISMEITIEIYGASDNLEATPAERLGEAERAHNEHTKTLCDAHVAAITRARAERDTLAAALAEVREAAAAVVQQVLGDDPSWWTAARRPDAANMVTTRAIELHDALESTAGLRAPGVAPGARVIAEAEERVDPLVGQERPPGSW